MMSTWKIKGAQREVAPYTEGSNCSWSSVGAAIGVGARSTEDTVDGFLHCIEIMFLKMGPR